MLKSAFDAPCSAINAATAAGASTERRASARPSGQQEEVATTGVLARGRLRAEATAKEKGDLMPYS